MRAGSAPALPPFGCPDDEPDVLRWGLRREFVLEAELAERWGWHEVFEVDLPGWVVPEQDDCSMVSEVPDWPPQACS